MPFIRQPTSSDISMIGQYLNARMAASSEKQYQPCNGDEPAPSETSSESAEHNCYTCELYKASARTSSRWAVLGWAMTFVLAVSMTVIVWAGDAAFARRCFDSTMAYSPMVKDLKPEFHSVRNNGSLHWPSQYRGPPSPEVDAAWTRLINLRPLNIELSDEEYLKIGRNIETAARNAPEHGGNLFVVPEFTHRIHCVNLLRKVSYFNFDHYNGRDPDFTDKVDMFKTHIDHCIEQLRQYVMCNADTGLVSAQWIEQRRRAWPDFNTVHMCRNFDAVFDWAYERQLPVGTPLVPSKPAGAKALPGPP